MSGRHTSGRSGSMWADVGLTDRLSWRCVAEVVPPSHHHSTPKSGTNQKMPSVLAPFRSG